MATADSTSPDVAGTLPDIKNIKGITWTMGRRIAHTTSLDAASALGRALLAARYKLAMSSITTGGNSCPQVSAYRFNRSGNSWSIGEDEYVLYYFAPDATAYPPMTIPLPALYGNTPLVYPDYCTNPVTRDSADQNLRRLQAENPSEALRFTPYLRF